MSAEILIANLLRVAKEDLEGARHLSPRLNRNAIYLCEQEAEKIIRAILTSEGKHAGIRHELRDMVNLVPDENPVKPALRAVEHLAAYATSYRYPTVSGRIAASPGKPILEEAASKSRDGSRHRQRATGGRSGKTQYTGDPPGTHPLESRGMRNKKGSGFYAVLIGSYPFEA